MKDIKLCTRELRKKDEYEMILKRSMINAIIQLWVWGCYYAVPSIRQPKVWKLVLYTFFDGAHKRQKARTGELGLTNFYINVCSKIWSGRFDRF